jgi:hypothetical protein
MRKTLIGAVASAALVASSLAGAATAATRVDGNHFAASGVRIASQGCLDPGTAPTAEPAFQIAKGPSSPPLGDRSVGWTPSEPGFGVGPTTYVEQPSSLAVLAISVYASSAAPSGQAVVSYVAPGTDGVWVGASPVSPDSVTGWRAVNAAANTFSWRHFTDGAEDLGSWTIATIASFVDAHGGDGDGAWVGFVFGCDGSPFYVDALQVVSAQGVRTLDFQGYRTGTSLTVGKKTRKRLDLPYGKRVDVTARLQTRGDARPPGTMRIDSRPLSAGKWTRHATRNLGPRGKTSFTVRGRRSKAYRASYAGVAAYEASRSHVLRIVVHKRVSARFADKTVTRGHPLTVTGRVLPSRAARVTLERYRKGAWRVVRRGSADSRGHYRMSAVARSLGASYWRIAVASGGGTAGGHSQVLKLRTQAPPSSGGGGGDPDPGDPGDPPPPPPPPPGPQRSWAG